MEKEFVPYELAVKLKALGFDEPCFGYYDGNHNLQFMYNGKPEKFTEKRMGVEESVWVGWISAPTFSQAFRWFRERYGLKHRIWAGKISTVFYGYDILNIDEQEFVVNNTAIGGGDCDFETYEEAELACLTKLIEIVEPKSE